MVSDYAALSDNRVIDTDVPGIVPGIPEPETYALMLAGLGLLGYASRRRRAA
jgi:hypothetical protein